MEGLRINIGKLSTSYLIKM
jgi:hypothetical protein